MSVLDNHPERDQLLVAGQGMLGLLRRLWPIHRSLMGPGLRETLGVIAAELPGLEVAEVPTGTQVLDWIVPDEWTIDDAFIETPDGQRLCDIRENNLHVMGYSVPVDEWLTLEDLQNHLYSLPDQPDAIPYVTSYYERKWGFCLSDTVRQQLRRGQYRAVIRSAHVPGFLNFGEWLLPGESKKEVLFSTYCCHPAMANNELSGPVLAVALAKWLEQRPTRRLTYRFLFAPEMIGAAAVLEKYRIHFQSSVVAAFNLTCVGDERQWSFLPSRRGDSYSDAVAKHVLRHSVDRYVAYDWNDRGSDESMFCAPGVDVPMISVMRSKYGEFPEYHTSLDVPGKVVTAKGLAESLAIHQRIIDVLETDCFPKAQVLGEPQLGRRGLYPQTSLKGSTVSVKDMLNLISYADGEMSLLEIADRCRRPMWTLTPILLRLQAAGVVQPKA